MAVASRPLGLCEWDLTVVVSRALQWCLVSCVDCFKCPLSTYGYSSHVGGQRNKQKKDWNKAASNIHYLYCLLPVESPLQNTLTLASAQAAGVRVVFVFCLSTLPPVCCLTERYDECCRRVELVAVSTPLVSHPSNPFHFTLPLLFLVTPLFCCLSFFQPTSLLLIALFPFFLFFYLISIPLSPNCWVSQHKGPSLPCSVYVCITGSWLVDVKRRMARQISSLVAIPS